MGSVENVEERGEESHTFYCSPFFHLIDGEIQRQCLHSVIMQELPDVHKDAEKCVGVHLLGGVWRNVLGCLVVMGSGG